MVCTDAIISRDAQQRTTTQDKMSALTRERLEDCMELELTAAELNDIDLEAKIDGETALESALPHSMTSPSIGWHARAPAALAERREARVSVVSLLRSPETQSAIKP